MKFLAKKNLMFSKNTSINYGVVVIVLFIYIFSFNLITLSFAEEHFEVAINEENIAATNTNNTSVDKSPPLIQIYSPINGFQTTKNIVTIKGKISDNTSLASLIIGNISYGISGKENSFNIPINLKPGVNSVTIKAIDNSNNIASKTLTIFVGQKVPPKIIPKITINKNKTPSAKVITITPKKQEKDNNALTIKKQPQTTTSVANNNSKTVAPKVEKKPLVTTNVKKEVTKKQKPPVVALNNNNKNKTNITKKPKVIAYTYNKPKKIFLSKLKKHKIVYPRKKSKKTSYYYKHSPKTNKNIHSAKIVVSIIIKNKNINTKSTIIKNRTFIALDNNFSNALSITYKVQHNSPTKIILSRDKTNVVIHQGIKKIFDSNNKVLKNLEFPPFSSNGKVMIPLRAVAESLGFTVHWDNQTKTVYIW